jgi:hypothetical protein
MAAPSLEPLGTAPLDRDAPSEANGLTERSRLEEAVREGWIAVGTAAPITPVVRQRAVARVQDALDDDRG